MANNNKLLTTLLSINAISHEKGLKFDQKLQQILLEIAKCMKTERGSIMLMKGRKNLEVVASTSLDLIGLKQPLDEDSPSSWVVKNKAPLRLQNIANSDTFEERFEDYKGGAFLLVPVISNQKVVGVINVTDKLGKDIFSNEEQDVLLNIASQIIGALENQELTESLRKKRQVLQKKNNELQKLEKLKTDLFSMLVHDLKGPISETVANLDILSYTVPEDNQKFVEAAQAGCTTLYEMVTNLLDIARLEENKLELVYEKITPPDFIDESVTRMFGLANTKGLSIVQNPMASVYKKSLWGDRDVLLRVLQNLLSNAIQYSPQKEIIEVGCLHLETSEIEFFVKDNGPGIDPRHHDEIFDKYKQISKKGDGRFYSTGLGLSFCKMAVEAHGGKIEVRSDGEKGSCFAFTLPLGAEVVDKSMK